MAKTREEKHEAKMAKRRAERVKAVFNEVAQATNAGERISTADLSALTGYSEALVLSTIHLVNSTLKEYGQAGTKMLDYRGAVGDEDGGWRVSQTWAERIGWHGTLHRHATTRVESLKAFADVMEGCWPAEAQVPGAMGFHYETAREHLDKATAYMAPRPTPTSAPKRARRAVRQIP